MARDPGNDGDFPYRRIPAERRHLVTAEFLPVGDGSPALTARFDIILEGTFGL
ncbi:MAG: hypothetical protein ACUVSD_05765 [Thiobacillaceae bacterium]